MTNEDLAIQQLPAEPAPGRADDPELNQCAVAAPAPAGTRGGERGRLLAVRDELSSLRARREARV